MIKKIKSGIHDVRGTVKLVAEATVGVTELVEDMHYRIVNPPFLPSTPIQQLITGIAGVTYSNVKLVTRLIGGGIDKSLGLIPATNEQRSSSGKREKMRAVLNGIVGDHLENSGNSLAISMQFRNSGQQEMFPNQNGKLLVLIHGLCQNDLGWSQDDHNHGIGLAKELNLTPVFLHYNSGRHISTNGKELSDLLENLMINWPVKVEEISFLAHSMGGLVTRSALHYGQQNGKKWISLTKKAIFLGSPFLGAPLEKAGSYVDMLLDTLPYVKPFARLGKVRSEGITDLRYGYFIDDHWQEGINSVDQSKDAGTSIPLPENICCYAIAATTSDAGNSSSTKLKSDGLVPVTSAHGKNIKLKKCINFQNENMSIIHGCKHNELLFDLRVYDQIKNYLSD